LASGALDWVTLGTPFQSVWLNIWLNIAKGISSDYGTAPAGYFFIAPVLFWGLPVAILVFAQSVIGGRRFPALFAAAIAILLTQSAIAHKEWRFIFPAMPLLITLCGIAVLQEITDIRKHWNNAPPNLLTIGALTIWSCLSLAAALSPGFRPLWIFRTQFVNAFALASQQSGLCGVNLSDILWIETPGSAALPKTVPIYAGQSKYEGYNVAITHENADLRGFRRVGCFQGGSDWKGTPGSACVWVRGGECMPGLAREPGPNWPRYFSDPYGRPRADRIRPYLHEGG
jgi:GPI mannosyltransferase 3